MLGLANALGVWIRLALVHFDLIPTVIIFYLSSPRVSEATTKEFEN